MILILIMAVLLIALISVIAQSMVGLYASVGNIEAAQQEYRLEQLWEDGLMQSLLPAGTDGQYLSPIGSAITNAQGSIIGHGLPGFITAPKTNSIGIEVRYCALATQGLTEDAAHSTITLSQGASYQVDTITINGRLYAYGSGKIAGLYRHSPNIVAFVVSPQQDYPDISCAGIQYDNGTGRYYLPNRDAKITAILAPHVFPVFTP